MAKSLKEQNRPHIWTIIAVNSAMLFAVAQAHDVKITGLAAVITAALKLLPVAIGVLITTVLNGVLSSEAKEKLVFLRRRHVLPSHRAFTDYAKSDPRVDVAALEELLGTPLPSDPVEQSSTWYSRLYKKVEDEPAVLQVHRDYLLLRDYTGLAILFLVFYGAIGLYAIHPLRVWGIYFLMLIAQFLLVRHSAAQRGIRMVTTVLAQAAAKLPAKRSKKKSKTG